MSRENDRSVGAGREDDVVGRDEFVDREDKADFVILRRM